MRRAQILVVEDESIVGKDIQSSLTSLGYAVPAVVASGEEALRAAAKTRPDLVLMDIRLKGDLDGIAAAERMRDHFHVPVVYLTAHADEQTLTRAKITEPLGYIVKPFEERELRTTIELALYRHRMERMVRESADWLATTLKCIGDGVIASDRNGFVTFTNPVAEALTGWEPSEGWARDVTGMFQMIDAETRAPLENPMLQWFCEGEGVRTVGPALLVTRDGRETLVEGTAAPIRDEARRVIGAVLVFRDITERKQMEERLAQAETFRAVGAMAAGCAHHLNNLFTVILGYNELALKTVGDPEVLRSLWVVNKAVRDGAEVVGRIRHVTSGAPSPELVPVDLNEIVEQVVELARPIWKDQTKARGSVIEVSLDCARIPMVPGDPLSLCEALLNPFLNAIEALPEGGRIFVKTWAEDDWISCSIADTGTGMNQEVRRRAMEPFLTTKGPRRRGLGLSESYSILQQHGGVLRIESVEGQGTTVILRLPARGSVARNSSRPGR